MMTHRFGKTIVVALGGSIMHPDEINVPFLKKFDRFIRKEVRRPARRSLGEGGKRRFILVVGGGRLARRFQDAAYRIGRISNEDKDWIGIHATRLNAHLVRTIFQDIADPVIIDAREKTKKLTRPVTVASGWRPGWSTDYIAATLAADFGAGEFVVAGKPSHVFDKDPQKYAGSKKFDRIDWRAYRKLIPQRWTPGVGAPVDPVAAALAEKEGIAAIVVGGKNLKNFGNLLRGKGFVGTIIQ